MVFEAITLKQTPGAADAGHGGCVLRAPALAEIVARSLYQF
jgi:hypothetical protein